MSNPKPFVSVLIITYNQEAYLTEAIDSVLRQDYEHYEIVVADDASSDGTAQLLARLEKKHPEKIRPLTGESNLGITLNTNRGLRHCKGEYIALLGGDDVMGSRHKLSSQVSWLSADVNRVICGHDAEIFDSDSGRTFRMFSDKHKLTCGKGPEAVIQRGIPYLPSTIMLRRDRIPQHLCLEQFKISSDYLFFVECLMPNGEYGFVPDVITRYRRHASNITNLSTLLQCASDLLMSIGYLETFYPRYIRQAGNRRIHIYCMVANIHLRQGEMKDARRMYLASLMLGGLLRRRTYGGIILTFMPSAFRQKLIEHIVPESVVSAGGAG